MKDRIIKICDVVIEYCFYTLLFAVAFSTSLVEIASTLMIAAWIVRKSTDREIRSLKNGPVMIFLVFMLWNGLSCFNSGYFSESFRGIFKVIKYFFIFLIAFENISARRVEGKFLAVMTAAALFISANGIFQNFHGYDLLRHRTLIPDDSLHRISSSFVHPNDFGAYLLVVMIITISCLFYSGRAGSGIVSLVVPLAVYSLCLFMTKSRGAWLSFAAAFLVLGALKTKKVLAVFLSLLLVVLLMLPYTAQEHIFSVTNFNDGTTWERLMLWKGTINMIKVHPILGFGVNTYSRNFPVYKPPEYPDVRYSHNCYLHMASEIGIIGALIFIVFLLTVLISCLRYMARIRPGYRKNLEAGLFAALSGFAINCIVDTHLYSVNLAVFFYLLLGYCYGLSSRNEEERVQ